MHRLLSFSIIVFWLLHSVLVPAQSRHPLALDSGADFATYLGGSGDDGAASVVFDLDGNACVVGFTNTDDFPTSPGAFRTRGAPCAVVAKLSSSGGLAFGTYLPGALQGEAIAVDRQGFVYVAGCANNEFLTTPDAYRREP
jgi:hypothetical protein